MTRPTPEIVTGVFNDTSWAEGGGFSITRRSYYRSYREHTSHSTPGYATLRRLKLLPDNGYQSMAYKISTGQWYYAERSSGDGRILSWSTNSVWHTMGSLPLTLRPADMLTDVRNRAFLRMASQASAVQVNLAQFFGERKQTAHMLASTVERVSQAALALKRADLRGFTRSLGLSGTESRRAALNWQRVAVTPLWKRIPSFWLEYIYGWRPLLSDVHNAAEMLAKAVVRTDNPVNFGTLKASASSTQQVASADPRHGTPHLCYDTFSSHNIRVKCSAQYELENEAKSVLAQTGISNPALLAWELLPYSFVVDWFIPVGNYLESLTAFDGFDLKRQSVSTHESSGMTGVATWYGDYVGPSHRDLFVGSECTATQHRYAYTPGGWIEYVPHLRSPIGGEPLERFATAMSLLTNLFRK